jgi:hypothetical protein
MQALFSLTVKPYDWPYAATVAGLPSRFAELAVPIS